MAALEKKPEDLESGGPADRISIVRAAAPAWQKTADYVTVS